VERLPAVFGLRAIRARENAARRFDLLQKDGLDKTSRERVKQASRELLASIKVRLAELDRF
jgi:type I restriction enzyme R subunit